MTSVFEAFHDGWKIIQTIDIDEQELEMLTDYCKAHNQVKGFYRYRFEGIVYETCVSYLLDYVKILKK